MSRAATATRSDVDSSTTSRSSPAEALSWPAVMSVVGVPKPTRSASAAWTLSEPSSTALTTLVNHGEPPSNSAPIRTSARAPPRSNGNADARASQPSVSPLAGQGRCMRALGASAARSRRQLLLPLHPAAGDRKRGWKGTPSRRHRSQSQGQKGLAGRCVHLRWSWFQFTNKFEHLFELRCKKRWAIL